MSLSPGERLGVYEIVSALGAGGMGEVYRARDSRLNRDVAIKILPDALAADLDRLARFTREAQVLAAFNHQNIAAIYGIEGSRALVMELVEGEDLFEGDDVSITIANVLKEDVRWNRLPADLPASAHRLLRRSLEKDPKRRLSSIGDARLELDDSTASPGIAASAPTRHQVLPWAVAALTGLAAIYLGWLALGRTNESSTAMWTSIPAPVDGFSRGMGPAVSPDGKWIVVGAPDAKGQDHLWVRSLA